MVKEVKSSSIRLPWNTDHDPYGAKLERRAIQLGIRKEEALAYSQEDIIEIEDISNYVKEQYQYVKAPQLDQLILPKEKPYLPKDAEVSKHLRLL
jgi:hypothetical protein